MRGGVNLAKFAHFVIVVAHTHAAQSRRTKAKQATKKGQTGTKLASATHNHTFQRNGQTITQVTLHIIDNCPTHCRQMGRTSIFKVPPSSCSTLRTTCFNDHTSPYLTPLSRKKESFTCSTRCRFIQACVYMTHRCTRSNSVDIKKKKSAKEFKKKPVCECVWQNKKTFAE